MQTEKLTCNKFHEQELARSKFYEQKINTQLAPWTKSVSWGGKSMFKSFTKRKMNMQQVSRTKSGRSKFHEQKSARNKFHEQIQFQKKKKSISQV